MRKDVSPIKVFIIITTSLFIGKVVALVICKLIFSSF